MRWNIFSYADFSRDVVTLFTITAAPPEGVLTEQTIANKTAFRYVRYLGPANSRNNVAEVEFYGNPPSPSDAPAE